jgi:hypothetical protein
VPLPCRSAVAKEIKPVHYDLAAKQVMRPPAVILAGRKYGPIAMTTAKIYQPNGIAVLVRRGAEHTADSQCDIGWGTQERTVHHLAYDIGRDAAVAPEQPRVHAESSCLIRFAVRHETAVQHLASAIGLGEDG